jgi:hypothetical protein
MYRKDSLTTGSAYACSTSMACWSTSSSRPQPTSRALRSKAHFAAASSTSTKAASQLFAGAERRKAPRPSSSSSGSNRSERLPAIGTSPHVESYNPPDQPCIASRLGTTYETAARWTPGRASVFTVTLAGRTPRCRSLSDALYSLGLNREGENETQRTQSWSRHAPISPLDPDSQQYL